MAVGCVSVAQADIALYGAELGVGPSGYSAVTASDDVIYQIKCSGSDVPGSSIDKRAGVLVCGQNGSVDLANSEKPMGYIWHEAVGWLMGAVRIEHSKNLRHRYFIGLQNRILGERRRNNDR